MSKSKQLQAVFSAVSRVGRAGPPHHPGKAMTHNRGVAEALDGLEHSTADDTHSEGSTAIVHNSPWAASRKGRVGLSEPLFPRHVAWTLSNWEKPNHSNGKQHFRYYFPPHFFKKWCKRGKALVFTLSAPSLAANQGIRQLLSYYQRFNELIHAELASLDQRCESVNLLVLLLKQDGVAPPSPTMSTSDQTPALFPLF